MNYTISEEQSAQPAYQRALAYELFSGRVSSARSLETSGINHPRILAYKARILGERNETKSFADWTEFLLRDYGRRKRCLSLGSGLGRVERYLMDIGFAPHFEAIELCANESEEQKIDKKRATVRQGDLNFADIAPGTYDFIICHGVLHHLINLEHILDQINGALTNDGIVLIYEYVGETRWQFSESRMEYLRKEFPHLRFVRPCLWQVRGFESVRSADLLHLIEAQFGRSVLKTVNYGGVYFPFVICGSGYTDNDVKRAVELDEIVAQDRSQAPCYHMGVYGKAPPGNRRASPWTNEELRQRLAPAEPITEAIKMWLRQSRANEWLRRFRAN